MAEELKWSFSKIRTEILRSHVGHRIAIVYYGAEREAPVNVSLECEDCSTVLEDYDLNNGEE